MTKAISRDDLLRGAALVRERFDELLPVLQTAAGKIHQQYPWTHYEELISIGYENMCRRAYRWDPTKGASLKTYLTRFLYLQMIKEAQKSGPSDKCRFLSNDYMDMYARTEMEFVMPEKVIAIDPGKTGAIAFWNGTDLLQVFDIPLVMKNKKKRIDIPALQRLFARFGDRNVVGVIENVHSMPSDGNASAFGFGETFGILKTFLYLFCKGGVHEITPQTWKKPFELIGQDKNESRSKAIKLYPGLKSALCHARDHNRAEALLILFYFLHYRSSK